METGVLLAEHFARVARPEIDAVYLFGSVAEGRQHRESDVDVAVLFSRAAVPTALERGLAAESIGADLISVLGNNRVDVVPLNDAPPLFARSIVDRGVCVFSRDQETTRVFQRDTWLRAADLEPFIERGRRRLLEYLIAATAANPR